jgi:hypothetical protein
MEVSHFNYLRRDVTYATDKAFHGKLSKYDKLCVILRKNLQD